MELEMEPADAPTLYDTTERSDGVDGKAGGGGFAARAATAAKANPGTAGGGFGVALLVIVVVVMVVGRQEVEQHSVAGGDRLPSQPWRRACCSPPQPWPSPRLAPPHPTPLRRWLQGLNLRRRRATWRSRS